MANTKQNNSAKRGNDASADPNRPWRSSVIWSAVAMAALIFLAVAVNVLIGRVIHWNIVTGLGVLINIAVEMDGYSVDRAKAKIDAIYENITGVLDTADRDGVNPHVAAVEFAEQRIAEVATLRLKRRPGQHRGVLQ